MSSRIVAAQEALVDVLREILPDAHVKRTYTPVIDTQKLTARVPTVLVTVDDVTTPALNSSWTKWTDVFTLTVYVGKKLENKQDATHEMDTLCGTMETLRDRLRRQRVVNNDGHTVQMIAADHAATRPIFDRQQLEQDFIFSGFLLVEVRINGGTG